MKPKATTQLKSKLRANSLLTLSLVVAGSIFFIGAFGTEGTRFDLYEFCFTPKELKNVNNKDKYCNKYHVYRGVTWLVAKEYETNPDFKKVTLIRGLKADRPDTGWVGLASSFFFLCAFLSWRGATLQYMTSLHKLIREKEKEILEFASISDAEYGLVNRKVQLETQYEVAKQDRQHAEGMQNLYEDWELKAIREKSLEQKETQDLERELHNETLRAEKEKQSKERYEAALDALKAKSKIDKTDPWSEERDEPLTKDSLKQKLKEHEGGWLWELVEMRKPLWVIGAQGSGKTNFASALVLCRYLYNEWKLVSIADPQFHQNGAKDAPWSFLQFMEPTCYGMDEEGNGYHWEGIGDAIVETSKRWAQRGEKDPIIQSLWDEVTNYKDNVDIAPTFTKRLNSDPRKANEAIVLLSHGDSVAMTGGAEGSKKARKDNSLEVHLTAHNKQIPTFKGRIEGWKNEDGEVVEKMRITVPKEFFSPQAISQVIFAK